MANLIAVNDYINENILHSKAWDSAEDTVRAKAVNNAEKILRRVFPEYSSNEIHTEDLAYQALWLLRLDDSLQRAEQGVTTISVEGIMVNLSDMDRTIAPIILRAKGIDPTNPRALVKRRVGSYSVSLEDTKRYGKYRGR